MSVTYPISHLPGLEGAKRQRVKGADRVLCALASAYYAWRAGHKLMGELRGEPEDTINQYFEYEFSIRDVPWERIQGWADPVPLGYCEVTDVNGITLDQYQLDTVSTMLTSGHILSLGCGLGKTVITIAAALQYKKHWGHDRLWVACPRNAFGAWERYRNYLEDIYADFEIISIDSLHKATGIRADLGGTLIFDEVHLLGVPSSKRTKLAHALRARFDCGICGTGTLLHGGIEKALSVLDLATPGASGFASKWGAGEFFKCLVKKRIGQRIVTGLKRPSGRHIHAFTEYLSSRTIALNKHSESVRTAINLPDQHLHLIELGTPWGAFEDYVVEYIQEWKKANPGEPIPHMQHVAHALARAGIETKIDWIKETILDSQPTIIFAAYLESLDALEVMLTNVNLSYHRIDGKITGKRRLEIVESFQAGEVDVFLGQMDAACTSIELTHAWRSIAVDHSWKATNYDQALARPARRGQTKECHHYDLVANPLQARIVERVRQGMHFDASVAEWQAGKAALEEM